MPVVDADNIPDAATRVRIHGNTYLNATSARAGLDRYPHLREHEITADCGPVPVHMKPGPGSSVRWTVWSDGQLLHGDVLPLPSQPARRLAAVESLLGHIVREAAPWRRGGGQVALPAGRWTRWLDADGMSTEDLERTVDERAVGPDRIATRVLALMRHTVHCVDGTDDTVYVLREQVHLPEPPAAPVRSLAIGAMAATTQILDQEAAARTAFAARNDHRPPVVTAAEAAAALGTTAESLRQAISRARRNSWHPFPVSVGRTNWYVMDRLAQMWHARPGHGPGRGHTGRAE